MQNTIGKLIQNRSAQVLFTLCAYLFCAPFLPDGLHQTLYTFSLFIKDLLLWMLPMTVGFFIAHAISSFEKKAPLFLLALFVFEGLSNGACVWYAFGCGHLAAGSLYSIEPQHVTESFFPLWRLAIGKPVWWSVQNGTLFGITAGLIAALKFPRLRELLSAGKKTAELVLTRFFSRLIPIYVLGFFARMHQTQLLEQMYAQYRDFFLWLLLFLTLYISLLFLAGSGFSFRRAIQQGKNLLPAAGIALSTGCSLSTMPWTIEGTSKNLDNPELAKAIIPATTNIQQIGDCIANTFLCFFLYLYFQGHAPSPGVWLSFSAVFVLARFATAAVLGGAIFLMLPIYESHLGFTSEMLAIVLAFNVILDPLITCSNVVANGALCRIFEKVWSRATPAVEKQKASLK